MTDDWNVELPHPLVEAFGRPTWLELRAPAEARALRDLPVSLADGEHRSIVVVPGFFGSTASLEPLTTWLAGGGYDARVVDLERNVRGSNWAVGRILDDLATHDEPPILIGHSRGGQQARVAARRHPELVGALITLGAPLRAPVPKHFVLRAAVESLQLASRIGLYRPADAKADEAYAAELAQPFDVDVPFTAIWSRNDGVVAWQQCADPAATSIEVDCSHLGLVESRPAFLAIASCLAAVSGRGSDR